ncbi:MAG: hypothetical protein LH606_19925, partial [Cytophagaceae bacterium]|nr:hypothetical protein [Cytophagaceae bacterium]
DEGRTGRKWIAEYLQKLHKVFPHPLFIHTASAARRGQFQKPEPIHNPVVVVNSIVGKPSNLYHQLRLMLHTTPAASRFLRLQRLKRLFEKDLRHYTIHVEDQATVNEIKLPGWYDFFPGLDGLALLGFSYLYAYDPKLVPFKVRKAIAG